MIPQTPQRVALGGRTQKFRSKDLHELLLMTGFDPATDEWLLLVSDTHSNGEWVSGHIDERLILPLESIARNPPAMILNLGDTCTHYVEWGYPPHENIGLADMQMANGYLETLTRIAPMKMILGNHDTHVGETPHGKFMLDNCRFFTELHHSFEVGGVRFIMFSTTHDGDIPPGEMDFVAEQLLLLTPGQELVLCGHQPGNARTIDRHIMNKIIELMADVENPMWYFCGHDHDYYDAKFAMPKTDMRRNKIGSGSGPWVHFAVDYMPTIAACTISGGKIAKRYAMSALDGYWYEYIEFNQPYTPVQLMLDGLAGVVPLAVHYVGEYSLATQMDNAEAANTWRNAGSWLIYTVDAKAHFPLPVGATKAFVIATQPPDYLDISTDGVSWTSRPVPAVLHNLFLMDIPIGMQSAPTLYFRCRGGLSISAWGFAP